MNTLYKGFEEMYQEIRYIGDLDIEGVHAYLDQKKWLPLKILRYMDWHKRRVQEQHQIDASTQKRINKFNQKNNKRK